MASPHFEVLRCSGHLLEPAVLQVSSLEEWEVMERSGVLRVCMNVCNFMLWELARGRGREGSKSGLSCTRGILLPISQLLHCELGWGGGCWGINLV